MTDLHCHILPGLDDGAQTMEDSLEMARLAAASGVRAIVATPHCNLPLHEPANYLTPELLQSVKELRQALEQAGLPLKLYPGAEIFCTPQLADLLLEQKLMTLGATRYLLMEFYFDEDPDFMEECFSAVSAQGCIPVVAHPERYEAIQRNPQRIVSWFTGGPIIQLNKGSILGKLGTRAQNASRWILERGLAHVVASDAHSPEARTTFMGEVRRLLEEEYDPEYARILLSENPARILKDLPPVEP